MFKLVIQDDEGKTTVVPLIRDEITIGRKEGNTIRLTERNVSRRHARIARSNGDVTIEDLGSYNGIKVNNARIAERMALRLSDQVQIGDYKLYLKSEVVEQVDDAKTRPHEKFESTTEVLQAMADPTAEMDVVPGHDMPVTAPVMAVLPASSTAGVAPISRSAAVETDAAGRPVATAAVVAALTTPVAHARLFILSSNFAGEEFELTRPQMILGRTSDNDIVVAHSSMSRNHAKIVRASDGRYIISDLQSSNGVRVNGTDTSRHELVRGDIVDLGHVRFRFVEPGEDFVFGRDAQITDVPESGSKKGLLIAGLCAAAVLGGIAYFVFIHKAELQPSDIAGQNPTGNGVSSTPLVADKPDSRNTNATPIDSNNSATGDKLPVVNEVTQKTAAALAKCNDFAANKKWVDAVQCASTLKASGAPEVDAFIAKMKSEVDNDKALDSMNIAMRSRKYLEVASIHGRIPTDSSYAAKANETLKMAHDAYEKMELYKVAELVRLGRCRDLQRNAAIADKAFGDIGDKIRQTPCTEKTAAADPLVKKDPPPDLTAKDPDVKKPERPSCDEAALARQGDAMFGSGSYPAALKTYDDAMKCSGNFKYASKAALSACKAGKADAAKFWYKKSPSSGLIQSCMDKGIDLNGVIP
jgi:ABC transport system ATP-binding/permease protein